MLTYRQFALFVVLGAIFWFSAAMLVRIGGTAIFTPSNPLLIVMYVAAFPVGIGFIVIARAVSGLPMGAMFVPTVVMTFIALMLDGIAVGFVPQLYGDTPDWVMRGAALILWGAGAGLLCAIWVCRSSLFKADAVNVSVKDADKSVITT
ncbi:MAG: hypothetical protein SGI73_06195 [Chloroflexota bacterium]|nr:hypothetical protein [Chloroflexota bacterium]